MDQITMIKLNTVVQILDLQENINQHEVRNLLRESLGQKDELIDLLVNFYLLGEKKKHNPPSP